MFPPHGSQTCIDWQVLSGLLCIHLHISAALRTTLLLLLFPVYSSHCCHPGLSVLPPKVELFSGLWLGLPYFAIKPEKSCKAIGYGNCKTSLIYFYLLRTLFSIVWCPVPCNPLFHLFIFFLFYGCFMMESKFSFLNLSRSEVEVKILFTHLWVCFPFPINLYKYLKHFDYQL